jgi:LuxR family transcriptional regulator, maltose regulon positive regulatory protein
MQTDFSPPYIYKAIPRLRLFNLLDDNAHKQNIMITGQAAQGKSTLVASYLKNKNHNILWFNLSKDDSHHTKLFDKLFSGIRNISEKIENSEDIVLPRITLGTEKDLLRRIEVLSDILNELSFPLTIVLDDLQSVDETLSGFQLVKGLVENQFKIIKLFLLSRTLPSFNIPRLKLAHHLFILENADLAFNLEETNTFFAEKKTMAKKTIEKIQQITDGWAGGLTLISESMRQFNDMPALPDRLTTEVFSYFSQEIYDNLSEKIQNFLIETAILDTIDLELIHHFFDSTDSLEILVELEKRNLFIQRMDSQGTKYKYHDLFKDFLLQELSKTKGQSYIRELNEKAGQFFWKQRDHEQALNYFIRAKSTAQIIHIIKIKGTDYFINGNMSGLQTWISHVPDSVIKDDPWLIFFQTMARRIRGGKKNIKTLQTALSLFERLKDDRGVLLSIGYLIEAMVFVRQPSQKILEWIKKGESILDQVGSMTYFPWARALLWQQIGLGYIAGNGNIPKGASACRNAILLGKQIENIDLILNASITLTFGYVQAGDFVNARMMLTKIQDMTKEGQHPEYRALKNIVDINFALKNGKFEQGHELLIRSENDIEKFGLIFLYPGFVEAKALHSLFINRYDDARQMADHLNDFSILEGNDFYKGVAHRIKAFCLLREEKYDLAIQEINTALNLLEQAKKGDIHHYLAQQLQGIIYYKAGEFKKARQVLKPALIYFQQISSDLSFSETALVLGLISWHLDDKKNAIHYLAQGIGKTIEGKYIFFPLLDEPTLIEAVVVTAGTDKIILPEAFASSLLSQYNPSSVFQHMENLLNSCKKNDATTTINNLRPLYRQLLPKIQIETFGQFKIFYDQKELSSKDFEGAKPILLLKAIVLHGSKNIPKEILIDALWPSADAKSGEKNFKINLHRLRKAIEATYIKQFGYVYILQKSGLVSLDSQMVTLDADEFMSHSKKAEQFEFWEEYNSALNWYDKSAKIYKGDYFSEEPYVEWIARKRDLFRSRYIDLLQKKAMLHEELDQAGEAISTWSLMLETDPYYETAYQNLMILYADSGQKKKALDLFAVCKQTLNNNLGIEPEKQTIDLFQKIQSI